MDYSKCDNYVVSRVGYRVSEYPDMVNNIPTYNLELKELHDALIHLDEWLDHDLTNLQVRIDSREVGLIPGMTFIFVTDPSRIDSENDLRIQIIDKETSSWSVSLSYRRDSYDNKVELFLDDDYKFKRINFGGLD